MKLYKYPLSGFWSQNTHFGQMTPLYYSEVIAGQSLRGRLKIKAITDSLKFAAMNRCYFDVFVFYLPFRVMWTGWQDFISQDLGGPVPTVGDDWIFNYEMAQVAVGGNRTIWQRHMYNHVYNDVFRSGKQAERAVTTKTTAEVLTRGRSFQNILQLEGVYPLPEETIDTSGATLAVDAVRIAQIEQKKQRLAYFFDNPSNQEYLQTLSRMGVQAGWEIEDMPRMIGQFHQQAAFETVVSTGDTNTASPSGFYSAHFSVSFGQRMFPEHGIIAAYLVPRIEFPAKLLGNIPLGQKTTRNFYYIDGSKQEPPVQWSNRFVAGPNGLIEQNAPAFEDYRTPVSQMYANEANSVGVPDDNYAIVGAHSPAGSDNADTLRSYNTMVDDNDFWRSFIGGANIACMTEVSGSQRSPVPPRHLAV